MYIVELNYPGSFLELNNHELNFEIGGMLGHLEGVVIEAAISLSMFEASLEQNIDYRKEQERDDKLRCEIDKEIQAEFGENYYQNFDKFRLMSERRLRARKAELGIIPITYLGKLPFIHAHTFVYAVDSFGKFLEELKAYDGMPEQVSHCVEEFNRLLPTVRKIRNSAMHIEDRSRGYGPLWDKKKGKKMDLQGFLGISNLQGNSLCYTIEDGSYQQVEVSVRVLNILVQLANFLLASFRWSGSARISPTY
ncbi:hypothetical protein ACPCT8_00075 [Aeromonas media]|uniref:hypothetical protein n=1 Tax=Aeromonas media TaxID=651 RepID=UPI003D006241